MKAIVVLLVLVALYTTSEGSSEQTNLLVAEHNKYRAQYGVAPLVEDPALVTSAKNWANRCGFSHTPGYTVGENLAWGGATTDVLFNLWVNEKSSWTCATNYCSGGCGHWTQIISKYSTKIGCATTMCPGNTNYLVCQYSPGGNNGKHPTDKVCSGTPIDPPPPVKAPTTPPTRNPSPPKPPTTPPTTPINTIVMPSFSKCQVSGTDCETSTCTSLPRSDGEDVYCGCNDPSGYDWPVTNANTEDCPYPVDYSGCTTDSCGRKDAPCLKSPWLTGGILYCPCSSSPSYTKVNNAGTPQCPYSTNIAAINTDTQTTTTDTQTPPPPPPANDNSMWIGIGIGAAILVIAIIIAIIIVLKKKPTRL